MKPLPAARPREPRLTTSPPCRGASSASPYLLSVVFIATIAITVLDVLWRRFKWKRNLKMTKQEVKPA